MADQQDMQTYVRGRLAGTVAPPQPAPDPMQSYVLAQGALGSRVPPDTMMDSPQFTQEPGVAPIAAPPSDKYQAEAARHTQALSVIQQMQAISKQMDALPSGDPARSQLAQQWQGLSDRFDQLNQQFNAGPVGQWANRNVDIQKNMGDDANVIGDAIRNRMAQPRQPLPPPAPGGSPTDFRQFLPAPTPLGPQPPVPSNGVPMS
jgi:hypothetical protein